MGFLAPVKAATSVVSLLKNDITDSVKRPFMQSELGQTFNDLKGMQESLAPKNPHQQQQMPGPLQYLQQPQQQQQAQPQGSFQNFFQALSRLGK